MMGTTSNYAVYKLVNGKLKELGTEKGQLTPILSNEFKVKDLNHKSLIELQELLHRQKTILRNKFFISKLPDKGEKLRSRCQEIESTLNEVIFQCSQNSQDVEKITTSININDIEWTKDVSLYTNPLKVSPKIECISSIDAEETIDPLELLATHSSNVPRKKVFKCQDDEDAASLIAKELSQLEIADEEYSSETKDNKINSPGLTDDISDLGFSTKLLKSLELKERTNPVRTSFKPYRPIESSTSRKPNRVLPVNIVKSSLWTESSATGLFQTSTEHPAKLIPLKESLQLLGESQIRENEQFFGEAARSLSQCPEFKIGVPTSIDLHYRDSNSTLHILDDSEDEENDGSCYISQIDEEE